MVKVPFPLTLEIVVDEKTTVVVGLQPMVVRLLALFAASSMNV